MNVTGRQEIAPFFVDAPSPPAKTFIVRDDWGVSNPKLTGGKAEFYVEYILLGEIDASRAKFTSIPGMKIRSEVNLAMTKEGWRIVPPSVAYLEVPAAVTYVTEMRDKTSDPAVRKKWNRVIAQVKWLMAYRRPAK